MHPISILDFIKLFEQSLKKKANIQFHPLLKGDVIETYADISSLQNNYNYKPKTSIEKGVKNFINWYKTYY
jgi:UDP-glucuronate 4-epimerase